MKPWPKCLNCGETLTWDHKDWKCEFCGEQYSIKELEELKPQRIEKIQRKGGTTMLESEIKEALELPENFGYSGDKPLGETWSIGPQVLSRDSDTIEKSNYYALHKMLEESMFEEGVDYSFERMNHWLVGWVEHLLFRVINEKGNPTDIFYFIKGVSQQLKEYPVLDEEDYSEREYYKQIEHIMFFGQVDEEEAQKIFSWIFEIVPEELDEISAEIVETAKRELGE